MVGDKKRLVVVADNQLIAEAVRHGLRSGGDEFNLLGYVNGMTASISAIADSNPDAVLVDDMSCSEQAISLIRALKQHEREMAVLVLTGELAGKWLERALEAGANGAISKSVQPSVLATLVREAILGHIVHAIAGPSAAVRRADDLDVEQGRLTYRELEILRLVASGKSNGEIARMLWVAEPTVKFHLRNIYRKLGVANRTEAGHYAHINRLLEETAEAQLVAAS